MADREPVFTRRTAMKAAMVPFAAVRGTAANSAIKVGLIGSGSRGTFVAGLMSRNTPARLVALCDIVDGKMEKAAQSIGLDHPKLYKDLRQLLASDVDAVIIATPVFLHPEHFEKAVQSGKHVYLEKPAAPDVEGCRRVERAAAVASKDRDLGFGFQRRHGEVYKTAYSFRQSGKIGSIRMASARFIKSEARAHPPIPIPKTFDEKVKNWSHWRTLSGDLIVENNCHLIDVLNWFIGGRPESASGEGGRTVLQAGDNRDHGTVAYQYAGKVQADLCGMTLAPPSHRDVREEFYGADGWLETSELHWRYRLTTKDFIEEKAPHNPSIDSVKAFVVRIESGKTENTIARGVESTLTAILGRLAMDLHKPVSWKEMLASNGWPG